jgi:lysophospholipid acyltransferase (LPLAT)-like uncharacterized protein
VSKSFLSKYRVDNVPIAFRPIFYLYGYGIGVLLFFALLLLRAAIKVEITGRENLEPHPNHIFCLWHSFVLLGLLSAVPNIPKALDRTLHAWMQHPSWYMKPVHVCLRLLGVQTIILGSTGHSGRGAADQLVEYLRRGYSTLLNPDGPQGPAFVLKKGIIHMSLQSGVPIVALQFSPSRFFELKTWDRKKLPLPFANIAMRITNPIQVTSDNFSEGLSAVTEALG